MMIVHLQTKSRSTTSNFCHKYETYSQILKSEVDYFGRNIPHRDL